MKITKSLMALLAATSAPVLVIASPMLDATVIGKNWAPVLSSTTAADHEIPNSYIVVFKKHVSENTATEHHSWVQQIHDEALLGLKKRSSKGYASGGGFLAGGVEGGDDYSILSGLKHTYNIAGSMMGYSGVFDDSTLEKIRAHPDVEYIEQDSKVYAIDHPEKEANAPWGLARISHRKQLGFGTFNQYLYSDVAGEGVDVYVIDTGTNWQHEDFEGRAKWGKTIPSGDPDSDDNGHGTHCSGTVAGKKYGVAKKAHVIAVKVLRSNGSGTMSDVVKGIEWAATSHIDRKKKGDKKFKGSAANMSLGGGKSNALDLAVNAAVDAGIHFAVAAGNDNANACNYSPAAADKAVTVGASTLGDERAYFSNYGKCVDIFAPGLNIKSTWIGSKYATNTISGTSMASPHIAGLLAYYIALHPHQDSEFFTEALTPAKLKKSIINVATPGRLTGIPSDTVNLLAWNGAGSSNYSDIFHPKNMHGKQTTKHYSTASELFAEGEEFFEKLESAVEKEMKDMFERIKEEVSA